MRTDRELGSSTAEKRLSTGATVADSAVSLFRGGFRVSGVWV